MKRLFLVLVAACSSSSATRPPTTPPADAPPTVVTVPQPARPPVVFEISKDGTKLGTLRITRGEIGVLETTADTPDAVELRALWDEIAAGKPIAVKMHLPTEDGSRGPLGAKVFQPKNDDYAEGVRIWLQYEESFDVDEVTR